MTLPPIKLNFLKAITDGTGILQHSKFRTPNRLEGYTTDDNARALIAATKHRQIKENSQTGKPWITPAVVARTLIVIVVAIAVILLELILNLQYSLLNLPLMLWTAFAFFLIWVFSLVHLLLVWASNTYVLRNDSLEIRTGILTSRSFIVAATGFADMEVTKSIIGRILNFGDIIIRTQDESGADKIMQTIRNPMKVSGQIREVMSRPIVRIEGQPPTETKK
jgi:membrane protein YdbS with pleckstrin-like domain